MLFVSRTRSNESSSYNHRLSMLFSGLRRLGLSADFWHLGNWIPPEPAVLSPLRFSSLLPRLRPYDIIHAGTALAAYPFCCYRRYFRATLIHDMHGHSSEMLMKLQREPEKIKGAFLLGQSLLLEELTIHRSDYHLVVSRPLLGRLLAHGVPRSRALVLRNGVDIDLFRPRDSPRAGGFTVCYAGDFQIWQGVDLLVEAAGMLSDAEIKFRFIGFRPNPGHDRWKQKIRAALGERADLVDRLSQDQLIEQLRSADLVVLPRPHHPATEVALPTKFAEYAALGKPVLVTDVDETAQFVRQYDCGLVCPPTPGELARAIGQARRSGPERLRAMGARGRRLAEAVFSWDVICRRYYDFLKTIERGQRTPIPCQKKLEMRDW